MKVIRMMKTMAPAVLTAVLGIILAVPRPAAGQAARETIGAQVMPGPGGRGQERPMRLILRDALGLTPDQEAELRELLKARMDRVQSLRQKMDKLRADLRGVMKDPKADQKKMDRLLEEMSGLRTEHMKSALRQRMDFEKILTPQQLEKVKTYRGSLMNRRSAAGGRHIGRPFGRRGDRMGRSMMRGFRGLRDV